MPTFLKVLTTILFVLSAITTNAFADDPEARAIMAKVDGREDGDRSMVGMRMILINKQGKERVRSIRSFGIDRGEDHLSLMFFLSPADVSGTGFLTYDYDAVDNDDEQWLFLPALNKTKRIAAGDKSGSFMGSDFSYADLTTRRVEDYKYSFNEQQREVTIHGNKAWVINAIPRDDKVAGETGYRRSIVFVRQDNFVVIRAIYFPKKGTTTKYYDVRKLEQIAGIWTATEIHMTTKKGKRIVHKTILSFNNVKYNQDSVNEDLFSIRRLEKGP